MGGFRFNGCGVTDHFKHIKSLGMHVCPNCKKLSEFTLDEANQKIDVFWIPTLTLKSRYAVMCKKCKNGEFCSVEWAGYLMNQTADQEVIFESVAKVLENQANIVETPEQEVTPNNNNISQAKPIAQPKVTDSSSVPHFFTCPSCGVTQMREGDACSYCGKPVPAVPVPEPVVPVSEPTSEHIMPDSGSIGQTVSSSADVTCPSCGSVQKAGNKFCVRCGQKLIVEQPKDIFCSHCGAQIIEGMLFCMECGSKI